MKIILILFFILAGCKADNYVQTETPPEWDNPEAGDWAGYELVEIPSSADGSMQKAYFRKATGDTPRPLIISLHTWGGNYKQADRLSAEAAARNWNFIHPDFRGANRRPEACGSALVISDIEDAVRYGVEHGNTNPDEVHIIGASGGGHATLLAYMTTKYPVKSFSAWVPISDLEAWYHESVGRDQKYAGEILKATSSGSELNVEEAVKRSPIRMAYPGELRKDAELYIYTGIHDGYKGSVPVMHSINMYNYIAKAQGADESDLVSDKEALKLVVTRQNPERDPQHKLYGRDVHFVKSYGKVSLTVFEGGHEQLPEALASIPVND